MSENQNWNDDRIAHGIAAILKWGALLASSLVLVGGVLFMMHFGAGLPNYHVFHGEPRDLRTIGGVINDVGHGDARGIIELGVLLLIATPIVRVAFSVFGWTRQKNYAFVVLTLIVLSVLAYSVFGAT